MLTSGFRASVSNIERSLNTSIDLQNQYLSILPSLLEFFLFFLKRLFKVSRSPKAHSPETREMTALVANLHRSSHIPIKMKARTSRALQRVWKLSLGRMPCSQQLGQILAGASKVRKCVKVGAAVAAMPRLPWLFHAS